jgi:hypothetical protein
MHLASDSASESRMQMQMHDAENIASKTLAAIKALLISCINIAAPIKNMQVKTKNLVPWFDKDLVILSKKRNRLYNKAISSK